MSSTETRGRFNLIFGVILLISIGLAVWTRNFILMLVALTLLTIFAAVLIKPLRNIATVVTSALIGFIILEAALIYLFTPKVPAFDPTASYSQPSYGARDTAIGYQPNEGVYQSRKFDVDGSVMYDVTYTIGPDRFRVNPNVKNSGQSINMMGGSFVFGEGLNEDQTLPYLLSEATGLDVRNYGIHGYGMHQALALMENDLVADADINIVFTIPWHALRSACKPVFGAGSPRYKIVDGDVVRDGVCPNRSIWRRLIYRSQTLILIERLFRKENITTDADVELYLEIIEEMHRVSQAKDQKFMIVFMKARQEFIEDSSFTNEMIADRLKKTSDLFLDVTLVDVREDLPDKYIIHPKDEHPSEIANVERTALIADALQPWLKP